MVSDKYGTGKHNILYTTLTRLERRRGVIYITKIKVGDRVKYNPEYTGNSFSGLGTVRFLEGTDKSMAGVERDDKETGGGPQFHGRSTWHVETKKLIFVGKKGKEVPPKFIVVYDLRTRDPYQTFTDEKELSEWIETNAKNPDFIMDSVVVYTIKEIRKMKFSWKLV